MPSEYAFIIGGTSGIGLATARRLVEAGVQVTIAGRDEKRLASAVASLNGRAHGVTLDAANAERVHRVFSEVGEFDHLILALGSSQGVGPFLQVNLDSVRKGFEEKVFPHFLCAQAALPHLRPKGSITFVSAVSGLAAMPGTAGIGSANAAVAALVPILAVELKPLRVNGVAPGVIDTPWWDFLPAEHKAAFFADAATRTPVARVGQADDVARAIAFLTQNTFITGHTLVCDGGSRFG